MEKESDFGVVQTLQLVFKGNLSSSRGKEWG